MNKKRVLIPVIVGIILIGLGAWFVLKPKETSAPTTNTSAQSPAPTESTPEPQPTEQPVATFDKTKYSIDEPGSLWWIVGKNRPLPSGYVPPDLVVPDVRLRLGAGSGQMQFSKQAEAALKEMFSAASKDSVTLVFGSGYRSYALQKQFYDSYVASSGQAAADTFSARPGTSEHQTGLSFDATSVSGKCHLEICFASTPEGKWLAANASRFGFIVRYPDGKQAITTYQYEPWHMRYVGPELAAELVKTGQTMEEFFGL